MSLYPGGLKSGMNFLLEPEESNFLSIKTSYIYDPKTDKIESNQIKYLLVPHHNWMTQLHSFEAGTHMLSSADGIL